MNILVIGGTQFMGPHVVRGLQGAGHQVTLLHRGDHELEAEGPRHIHGDRRDAGVVARAVAEARPEVVVDMVAMLASDGEALVEAARGRVRRVVLASSIDVYRAYGRLHGSEPGPPEPVPLTEDSPLREKLHPYRADPPRPAGDPDQWRDEYDKIPVERTILGGNDLEGVVLRLPMVYGPDDRQHRLYPYLKRMLDGRGTIPIGVTHSRWRTSRGFVENVADAIVLTALSGDGTGHVYNVAEETDEDEQRWIQAIGGSFGWAGSVATIPDGALTEMLSPDEAVHHIYASSARIRMELGYRERIGRAEALRRTIEWERDHPPQGWPASLFDYEAEDRALTAAR
jgi:nucleoside-diphosphate-sugar epimerase